MITFQRPLSGLPGPATGRLKLGGVQLPTARQEERRHQDAGMQWLGGEGAQRS